MEDSSLQSCFKIRFSNVILGFNKIQKKVEVAFKKKPAAKATKKKATKKAAPKTAAKATAKTTKKKASSK